MRGELWLCLAGSTKRGAIQYIKILAYGSWGTFRFDLARGPILWIAGILFLNICNDEAGIRYETLTADKALFNAPG